MTRTIGMPRLSDSMEEATIIKWLKQPGEPFVRGEPLVEVETDKATVVYEAEHDGVLADVLVREGEAAALGEPIALVEGGAAETSPVPVATAVGAPSVSPPSAARDEPAAPSARSASSRVRATPVARRAALELGVSLTGIDGTGYGGRIRQLDVVRAAKSGAPAAATSAPAGLKGEDTVIELTTTRATIARRMGEAAAIPVFSASIDVDLSAIADLRRSGGVEMVPSINDFVVKAAALTLRELPHFNASFVDGRIVRHSRVNVGIAVATDEALLVPAVVDADRRSLAEITSESRRLSQAARERRLQPDELAAGTFTVSNLGMFGVTTFTAVLNVPQVAILAVGAAVRRPVESPDGVVFRDVATLTLTGDHRAVYGADAARFLAHLRDLLEHPLALVL